MSQFAFFAFFALLAVAAAIPMKPHHLPAAPKPPADPCRICDHIIKKAQQHYGNATLPDSNTVLGHLERECIKLASSEGDDAAIKCINMVQANIGVIYTDLQAHLPAKQICQDMGQCAGGVSTFAPMSTTTQLFNVTDFPVNASTPSSWNISTTGAPWNVSTTGSSWNFTTTGSWNGTTPASWNATTTGFSGNMTTTGFFNASTPMTTPQTWNASTPAAMLKSELFDKLQNAKNVFVFTLN